MDRHPSPAAPGLASTYRWEVRAIRHRRLCVHCSGSTGRRPRGHRIVLRSLHALGFDASPRRSHTDAVVLVSCYTPSMSTTTRPPSDPNSSGSEEDTYSTARYEHWQYRPESFAAFYKKPLFMTPAGIVARFLEVRTRTLEDLLPIAPGSRLLDVGCGSGEHMIRYVGRCAFIAGIDYSRTMLNIAESALTKTGRNNWELRTADAASLPYPDESFDALMAMGLLDYVPDAQKVLREFARVLRPGGQMVVSIPKDPSLFSLLRTRFGNWIKRHVFQLPPVGNAQTRASLEELISSVGLRLKTARPIWTAMWIVKAVRD